MRKTNIYQGLNGAYFLALIAHAANESEKNTLSTISHLLLTHEFDVPESPDETGDWEIWESALKVEREIADRAVAAMRACGFERRVGKEYAGDPENLQREYALDLLLGRKPSGERHYVRGA